MRIRLPHIPYISRKIAIDMLNSGFITFSSGIESVAQVADEILREDVAKERALDEKVNEILDDKSEDMHIMQVDKKSMFWLVKKRLAEESGLILNHEDRYNSLSHKILEVSWKRNLIDYKVSENRAKNVIYLSIEGYLKSYEDIEDAVIDKIDNLSKKLIAGTEEYDLTFERYYEDELKRRGMF
ncbi:DUF507 family protein [Campylobacter geochelonis]|uniref:Competence/damage-inducible domain-containing protein n=1 Tax=Campylobacter geochelonis TaxID=1780362 RepID=A0A128EK16_9BACT|nr:DUF507 family protein [Campylobacter geochelonis]QKF71987.1 DUF507 domain-containing protein [Campylobacter geochelonis]CZE47738.1 competence/damage-inducible domain-containing protein [Campylobacter geochelonis]CZE48967.1 competence/damage-inducible domain-containing protein [Campylobacter geochelonis]CZE49929.1 competence/damage-inducible domain-containing protein [Campylobacter geochelonis]